MKQVRFTVEAAADLRRHRSTAKRLIAKIERYAASGAGDVKQLVGSEARRLRDGDFRIVFAESAEAILVTRIGPRGSIYG